MTTKMIIHKGHDITPKRLLSTNVMWSINVHHETKTIIIFPITLNYNHIFHTVHTLDHKDSRIPNQIYTPRSPFSQTY